MASFMGVVYTVTTLLLLYWVHKGWRSLVTKGKHESFRLEQRRRAGIPDSDHRPFNIAQAEAAQLRRRKRASLHESAAQKEENSRLQLNQKPFNFVRQPTKPASSSPFRAAYNQGHESRPEMRQRQSQSRASPAFAPGQSQRYSPATYRPSDALASTSSQSNVRKRGADVALSEAGDIPRHRHSKIARDKEYGHEDDDDDDEGGSEMTWEKTTASQNTATRGKKRDAEDVRDAEEEDSVIDGRGRGKRGKKYDEGDSMDEDEPSGQESNEDDEDELMEEDEQPSTSRASPIEARAGSKVMRSLDDVDDRSEEESDVRSRRASAKPLPRRIKQSKAMKKPKSQRSLRDDMMSMDNGSDESATQFDDSMQSIQSRRRSSSGKTATAKNIPDEEREIGEEWTDPTNGLQWRMDEDEVMTEEEGSLPGRKRRVKVKRRVKRRLTVRKEMRQRWEMPADSLHQDKSEVVPHYVPAWLSVAEFEDAKNKGELGFQAGDQALAKAAASIDGSVRSTGSPSSRARNLDLLFHQPANPTPLRSLSSSQSRSSSFHPSPRERSSTPQLRGSAASSPGDASKKSTGRISLSAAPSSERVNSPLRTRALDTAAKRRREEELLRRLREDAEQKRSRETTPQVAPSSASVEAAPASSPCNVPATTSKPEEKPKLSVAFAPVPPPNSVASSFASSLAPSASSASSSSSAAPSSDTNPPAVSTGSSPFSFGQPPASTPAPSTNKQSESKPAFSFNAPKVSSEPKAASTAPATSNPSFSFGATQPAAAAKTESKPASSPFNFGSSSTNTTAPKQSTPAFTSGSTASTTPSAPSATSATTGSNGGFSFSASKPAAPATSSSNNSTPFTFGAPPATNQNGNNGGNAAAPVFNFGSGGAGASKPAAAAPSTGGFSFNFGKK